MGDTIKFTEIDWPILTPAEELERIAMEQEDAELNKVFDKALDKAFNEAVKRHTAMLHQEVFAILGPVFDALFDQAVERHRDMLSDEARDAAVKASGLMPYWVGGDRFMSKWVEPAGEQITPIPEAEVQALINAIIASGYRAMSKKCHPDKGGSADKQHRLTVARDILVARSKMTPLQLALGGAR